VLMSLPVRISSSDGVVDTRDSGWGGTVK
jgi:hypothetical protein